MRRWDSLFVRLFVLMWVTLVVSHFVAFSTVTSGRGGPPPQPHTHHAHGHAPSASPFEEGRPLPVLPSLPPGSLWGRASSPPSPPASQPSAPPFDQVPQPPMPRSQGLSTSALWLDYGIRMLIIALGAWWGARWLSRPMRDLSDAALGLSQALSRGQAAPKLNEARGTVEVREAAQVFNQMAQQLQQQFDARGLHMAAVSHDLRTPLTRLRMRLTRWPDEAERAAADADIHEMDALIGDTLAVLREQHDGSEVRPIAVAAFLQALSDDMADQGQAVTCELPPTEWRVSAHPVALRRILSNLLGNALRHAGSAHLHASTQGGWVLFDVDDHGPGIPPEHMAQAFEPWVRLSDSSIANPSRTGHGLGLAIARDLALRDGGHVSLENRPTGGLRARLALPMYTA